MYLVSLVEQNDQPSDKEQGTVIRKIFSQRKAPRKFTQRPYILPQVIKKTLANQRDYSIILLA